MLYAAVKSARGGGTARGGDWVRAGSMRGGFSSGTELSSRARSMEGPDLPMWRLMILPSACEGKGWVNTVYRGYGIMSDIVTFLLLKVAMTLSAFSFSAKIISAVTVGSS